MFNSNMLSMLTLGAIGIVGLSQPVHATENGSQETMFSICSCAPHAGKISELNPENCGALQRQALLDAKDKDRAAASALHNRAGQPNLRSFDPSQIK